MAKAQPRERTVERKTPAVPRKPYRAPKLVAYGDLRTITLGKGGNMDDGTGEPATRK